MTSTIPAPLDAPAGHTRRPWVAAVLSLIAAGTGHLYAGAPRRAAGWWAASMMAPVVVLATAVLLPARLQLTLILVLVVALPVTIAWDAARTAKRRAGSYRRGWYNRWYVYVGVMLVSIYAVHPLVFGWVKTHIAEAFRIPSGAMAPTLQIGDYILATPLKSTAARGRLAVYRSGGQSFIKRVVALAGDTLAMQDGQLLLNSVPVLEPYAEAADADPVVPEFLWQREHVAVPSSRETYQPSLQTWGPLIVPPHHVFVLGDSRGNSADSRYIGFIAADSIVARPTVIYFSRDVASGEIRWSRIGRAPGE